MNEAVKRYWLESFIDDFYKARQFVLAADHDRIVAELKAENKRLLGYEDLAILGEAKALEECDTLRAEVELLKEHEPRLVDVERLVKALSFLGVSTPESMEESCIRWLSLVRTLIRTAEDSKMLRQDSERLAEVEVLRKDAALFRRLRDLPDELLGAPGVPCVAIPEGQRAGRYVSGPDLDAALEASR